MKFTQPDITEIIIRQLQGKTSAAEDKILEDWLNDNPDHFDVLNDYRKVWNKTGEVQETTFQPNVDLAWSKVAKKANLHETPVRSIQAEKEKKSDTGFFRSIAAVLVLLTGLGYLAFKTFYTENIEFIEVLTQTTSKEVKLPDGSEITLNKNSSLKYPAEFSGNDREVFLNGNAYFSVVKDENKPFVIKGKLTVTEVLGTSFYISSGPGYEKISVYTGKVAFSSAKTNKKAILTPGETASFTKSGEFSKYPTESLNTMAWKTRKLEFDDASLKQVKKDLESYFGKEVRLQGNIEDNKFTGSFPDPDLKQVLEVVSISTDTHLSIKDSIFTLSENSQP